MATKDKENKGKEAQPQTTSETKSKVPFIAVVVVIAAVAVGALFLQTRNGVAESQTDLSDIAPASADSADEPVIKLGNPVVAVVNGENVERSDVFKFISGLPEQVRQMPIQTLFPMALEQVVNNHVIAAKAGSSNLGVDPEVEQLVEQAKGQIVRNVFVERQVKENMTQKKLLKSYEQLLDNVADIKETKASHILLETEEAAQDVIAKLTEGLEFADLAKEFSTGPSAQNGGDLGYFAKAQMVPEFAEVAFELEPGAYTQDPVKTQFGWHVIKVEDRRTRPEPKFEDVKPQLEAQLRQQTLADLVKDWQKEAKIKKFDINGDEIKK